MIRYDRRFRVFAMSLSALAGFVDATGFVLTGGLFVSFMSGNSTRLAVAFAGGSNVAFLAGALVALFLVGVVGGALIAPWKPAWRKTVVLASSAAALILAASLITLGLPILAALTLAAGMGALNNVFLRQGEVSIGVTYMTGTLVRAGQRIAGAVRGEGPSDWQPYLLLWASLVCGAVAGAFLATSSVTASIWVAGALAIAMAFLAYRLEVTSRR
jgi:uncharacterized membrane protein YoaK (UPF0700 family)